MVNLQQFELEFLTVRILDHRFLENLLGRFIAPVSEIHLGFGHRVDLVGMDVAHAALAEVAEERRVATGGRGGVLAGYGAGGRRLFGADGIGGKNAFLELGDGFLATA